MARRGRKETVVSKILKKLYYDPKSIASYGGKAILEYALEDELQKRKIRRKNLSNLVEKWLEDQQTYTLHKQPQKNFTRRRVIVGGINDQWQTDLADMQAHSKENDGYKYILMVMDCFSRKAWARPLKDKSGKSVADAFSDIFKDQSPPTKLQSDKGREFYNSDVNFLFKKKGVTLFSTEDPATKACMVERLNRTIKVRMYGYFHAKKTTRWIDILQDLILSYNSKVHSVIKMAPNQVSHENAHIVRKNNEHNRGKGSPGYNQESSLKKGLKFKPGDIVRMTAESHIFKKKYLPRWTQELFKVNSIMFTVPVVYTLEDTSGEVIEGTFYEQELQKVTSMPELFEIEDVLEEKGNNILVKWKGYPASMNQWIKKSALKKI